MVFGTEGQSTVRTKNQETHPGCGFGSTTPRKGDSVGRHSWKLAEQAWNDLMPKLWITKGIKVEAYMIKKGLKHVADNNLPAPAEKKFEILNKLGSIDSFYALVMLLHVPQALTTGTKYLW